MNHKPVNVVKSCRVEDNMLCVKKFARYLHVSKANQVASVGGHLNFPDADNTSLTILDREIQSWRKIEQQFYGYCSQ